MRNRFPSLLASVRLTPIALFLSLALAPMAAQQNVIQTVAGSGQTESFVGTSISPGFSSSVAVDSSGNAFVAIADSSIVVRIDAVTDAVSVIAGTGVAGYGGDNGQATSAKLNGPIAVAIDGFGNLYIADSKNYRVRKVSSGVITTIAGNGTYGTGGDGGPATSAQLLSPLSVAATPAGDVYILENIDNDFSGCCAGVRKVSNGVISSVQVYPTATNIAVDSAGNLYWPEARCAVFGFINGSYTQVAGNFQCGYSGDNGPATSAKPNGALGVAVDPNGNVYIADATNNRIRRVSNGVITTVAGNGTLGDAGDGGPATAAQFMSPGAVAVGAGGTFYSDESIDRLQVISVNTGYLTHGGIARVTATVWAWDNSSDALDLYYAANANSPRWLYIATLKPKAAGLQNLSATFKLPPGHVQAVRANFRYLGTKSSCSAGSYDDHDDLVFVVR